MAKQLVNPLERHAEKAVLAVAVLVLIAVIAKYLVSSPNKIEIGGETVTPRTVDVKLADRATETLQRMRNAQTEGAQPKTLAGDFESSLAPLTAESLALAAPFAPEVPLIDPPITVIGGVPLVQVVQPQKPSVTFGRSTVNVHGPGEQPLYEPRNWATVSAVFDVKTQIDLQKHAYGATQAKVLIVPPEIQRRTRRMDGSWSDDDWQSVEPFPSSAIPSTPQVMVVETAAGPRVSADNASEIEKFRNALEDPPRQREMLRPLMMDIANGTPWSFPLLIAYREVLMMDDQILNPAAPPSSDPMDMYRLGGQLAKPDQASSRAGQDPTTSALAAAEAVLESARKNRSKADAIRAYNMFQDIAQDPTASSTDKTRAQRLRDDADQLSKLIAREELLAQGPRAVAPGAAQDAKVVREPLPTQQVWVHDAGKGSVSDGQTYQYRMRFQIFNQFAGRPEKFDDPTHATLLFVTGDWSEPSDAVTFEPSFAFYVVADDRARSQVGVEFFQWVTGDWVKSRRAKFGVGDRLRDRQQLDVPSLTEPGGVDRNVPVVFDAGKTVVDLAFDYPVRERRPGGAPSGVKFGPAKGETAVVLMDENGRLSKRLMSLDKNHPDKRSLAAKMRSSGP